MQGFPAPFRRACGTRHRRFWGRKTQVLWVHRGRENASTGLGARVFSRSNPPSCPGCYGERVSRDARRELVDALRYVILDLLDSNRGRWAAALVFGAGWGAMSIWFPGWGVVLGWIPAAVLAIYIGYACR